MNYFVCRLLPSADSAEFRVHESSNVMRMRSFRFSMRHHSHGISCGQAGVMRISCGQDSMLRHSHGISCGQAGVMRISCGQDSGVCGFNEFVAREGINRLRFVPLVCAIEDFFENVHVFFLLAILPNVK